MHVDSARSGGGGVTSPTYAAVRWLWLASLTGLIGAAAFRWLVLPAAERRGVNDTAWTTVWTAAERRAAWCGAIAAAVLVAATIGRLFAERAALRGASDMASGGTLGTIVEGTQWGSGWLLQVVTAAIALIGLAVVALRRDARATGGWAVVGLATLVAALAPALSGHAIATPRLGGLAVTADALHVLAAGGWMGGLLVLLVAGVASAARAGRWEAVAGLVSAFSPMALACAAVLVATGTFAAWLHLGSVGALWGSGYGRTLLVKLALLVPALGAGAYNWRRVRPALHDARGAARLQRWAMVELVAGAAVIAATAVLVALEPPA
jgi:putative copper export protein